MISYERMSLGAAETCGCHWDVFDRSIGYSLNSVRQTTLAYDPATGRLASMRGRGTGVPPVQSDIFAWSYLPGTDLKSQLTYPNGLTATWAYDANSRLTQARNATASTISQYDYTYDAAGRRVSRAKSGAAMSESRTDTYGYSARSEVISADKKGGSPSLAAEHEYACDPFGNLASASRFRFSLEYADDALGLV